jgi:radical SAM superfamily enzyme YgiQ (UPF0313 family)
VIWKISCRAENVEPELFAMLRDAGLYLVYMGIESGTDAGLEVLHKQLDVATNRYAIDVLKELGLLFEYGFMLFDPSLSFESIRANVDFMRTIIGDGSAGATFCRMLAYGGKPIRARLAEEGRLRGDVTRPDYDFLDPRLDDFHRLLEWCRQLDAELLDIRDAFIWRNQDDLLAAIEAGQPKGPVVSPQTF